MDGIITWSSLGRFRLGEGIESTDHIHEDRPSSDASGKFAPLEAAPGMYIEV